MVQKNLSLVWCYIHINSATCCLHVKEYKWILMLVELMVHFIDYFNDLRVQIKKERVVNLFGVSVKNSLSLIPPHVSL